MDVSQFLKSFKKTVAATAVDAAPVKQFADANSVDDDNFILDSIVRSDSDVEDEKEQMRPFTDHRTSRVNADRYRKSGEHLNRVHDFDALRVFATNTVSLPESRGYQRQRSSVAKLLRAPSKRPNAEMVASMRAELLRKREALRNASSLNLDQPAEVSVKNLTVSMMEVDNLLTNDPAVPAPSPSLLSFLPQPSSCASTVPSVASTAPASAEEQPPSQLASREAPTSPLSEHVKDAAPTPPCKKKSKFEMAISMVRGDDI